jgi:hypothetical protein
VSFGTDLVLSIVGGAAGGGVVTAWNQWGIEKRRQRREARATIIAGARALVAEKQHADRGEILRDPRYLAIEPHLTEQAHTKMHEQQITVVSDPYGTVGGPYLNVIRREAERLERQWKLV